MARLRVLGIPVGWDCVQRINIDSTHFKDLSAIKAHVVKFGEEGPLAIAEEASSLDLISLPIQG